MGGEAAVQFDEQARAFAESRAVAEAEDMADLAALAMDFDPEIWQAAWREYARSKNVSVGELSQVPPPRRISISDFAEL